MKKLSLLLGVIGLALITFATGWFGAGKVMESMLSVGIGGFALLVLWQFVSDALLALAWRTACPRPGLDVGYGRLLLARLMREAGTTCLPFSQLGGILLGIRATAAGDDHGRGGSPAPSWSVASAANVVDLTAEVIGQIGFVLVGLLFLIDRRPDSNFAGPVGVGMLLFALAIGGFIWAQRSAGDLMRRASAFLGDRFTSGAENLQDQINRFYARPGRIAAASCIHCGVWLLSAVWVWLAYRLLGASLSIGDALAIEGVASGVLSVSFLVPAALGVQELSYVALGSLFGLDPQLSLSLSLLRRGRDVALGVPMLLYWQATEVARLRKAAQAQALAQARAKPVLDPLGR